MNKFVFAVCGARVHIDELHFSIERLKRFSKCEVVVVTDSRRNEIPIIHENIIDVHTPDEFDNHQASIFIKTGLNKFLPSGHKYCYLDSDVVCISDRVDEIFNCYISPIIFAKDYFSFALFSPHAVNCNCIENHARRKDIIAKFKAKIEDNIGKVNLDDEEIRKQAQHLAGVFAETKRNFFKSLRYLTLRYLPGIKSFSLDKYTFDRKRRCWKNEKGDVVELDFAYYKKKILPTLGENPRDWQNFVLETPQCNHLSEYIRKTYSVDIPDGWRHWNGGVFIFDDSSEDFLNYWHETTVAEFANPYTKTRDQGTLAMAVWQFGLQNHPSLPNEFNWIAEFGDENIGYKPEIGYTADGFKTIAHPVLMHIYHHWGDESWSIWNSIVN